MTTMEHPRAIAPMQHMVNVHPSEVVEGDIMKHLGAWCTVTQNLAKPDGSHAIYFVELSQGALIPMLVPEGTLAVSVIREKTALPSGYCPICKKPSGDCSCGERTATADICPRCHRDMHVCVCDVD